MRELELPYPLLVGRLEAGRWSSAVPDRLRFEGRLGVRVGERSRTPAPRSRPRSPGTTAWPADRDRVDGRAVRAGRDAARRAPLRLVAAPRPPTSSARRPLVGVPYGADMRHFTDRGIPCVMFGTPGLERAHAADEYADVADMLPWRAHAHAGRAAVRGGVSRRGRGAARSLRAARCAVSMVALSAAAYPRIEGTHAGRSAPGRG